MHTGGSGSGGDGNCGANNAALGHPATASSVQDNDASYSAPYAVDGSSVTRWSSAYADPQWLQVDLGASLPVCKVVLRWENAFASAFQIQVSDNGSTWNPISATTAGIAGRQTLNVSGTGRYIRMYGTARATAYGYALWEFEVYTVGGVTATIPRRLRSPRRATARG
ncbi:discoidin domain-containing protein [Kutzneria kofuensis]|uniref:discoidin domain-containing protein n=1 Tax=Kutzneria kofuensis TaxID=103725 RepID=UPI003CD09A2F